MKIKRYALEFIKIDFKHKIKIIFTTLLFLFFNLGVNAQCSISGNITPDENPCSGRYCANLQIWSGRPPYTIQWDQYAEITDGVGYSICLRCDPNPPYNCPPSTTVIVTDADGCTYTGTYTRSFNGVIYPYVQTVKNSCSGQSTGTLKVYPDPDGCVTYSYLWSNGATTQTISNLAAGNYSVTIGFATNNCSYTLCDNVQWGYVTNASGPTVNTTTTPLKCKGVLTSGGSATVSASGGGGGYTYTWSSGSNATTISNIAAGTYTATVSDANGCTASKTAVITQPATSVSVSANINNHVLCFGQSSGNASAIGSGGTAGYSYSWSPGSHSTSSVTNLSANTYTVTVTDANLCTSNTTLVITQPSAALGVLSYSTTPSTCDSLNGSASVQANGGVFPYTFSWSPAGGVDSVATGLGAGSYTVVVSDSNNCIVQQTLSVNSLGSPILSILSIDSAKCFNEASGSATVTVSSGGTGALVYSWSSGIVSTTGTATGLMAGTYSVLVTDSLNCKSSIDVEILEPSDSIKISTSSVTNILCKGENSGAVITNVVGGTPAYIYSWSDGSTTTALSNLVSGTYTLNVTDHNNCNATLSVTLTEPTDTLSISATSINHILCKGQNSGSATVGVSGGTPNYSYSWSTGSTNASASSLVAGVYTLSVVDGNSCSAQASITLTEPSDSLLALADIVKPVSCFGGSDAIATVVPMGGTGNYTYSWSNGASMATVNNLSAQSYSVLITDANGCYTSSTVSVVEPLAALSASLQSSNLNCFGKPTGSITVLPAGGTAPYSYSWSSSQSSQIATGLAAGSYSVLITDSRNCTAFYSSIITQPQDLVGTAISSGAACPGESITLSAGGTDGTPPYEYSWSNGSTNSSIQIHSTVSTNYSVIITDACNSSKTATVLANIYPKPMADFEITPAEIIFNKPVTFANQSSSDVVTWMWNFGDNSYSNIESPSHTYTITGDVFVMLVVTNQYGCMDTAVYDQLVELEKINIPNVFTPNGDGVNDVLFLDFSGIDQFIITIYDRWGLKMFESDNPNVSWDGRTLSGNLVPSGTYYYIVSGKFKSEKEFEYQGYIQVIQ